MDVQSPPFLKPAAVAARLNVYRATVHRLIAAGVIPAVVLRGPAGRRLIRVPAAEFERVLRERHLLPASEEII